LSSEDLPAKASTGLPTRGFDPRRIVLIGASTGGVDALTKVVRHFSDQCPPTLIVQHTGSSFTKSLIRLINGATDALVEEAAHGTALCPGHIYLPPDDQTHLCLSASGTICLDLMKGDLVSGHRPSIDALFNSARPYARHVSAALLTGMGRDGASGLTELRKSGAHTIGQDEKTSVVYGMPRIAHELGGVIEQLPIDKIGPALLRSSSRNVRT
jgi:two-component system chemotaxis response regulator CheB